MKNDLLELSDKDYLIAINGTLQMMYSDVLKMRSKQLGLDKYEDMSDNELIDLKANLDMQIDSLENDNLELIIYLTKTIDSEIELIEKEFLR